MKKAGLILIIIGFLGGAYVGVLDAELVDWTWMGGFLSLGVAGVVLVQLARVGHSRHEGRIAENIAVIEQSLDAVIAKLGDLDASKASINTYDVCHRIDDLLIEDLNAFVDARETIGHAYTLQSYANVMSHFAAGERYLNRVWSASADGYIDEVNEYLPRALAQFVEARDKLVEAKAQAGG
jgi:hypothetical protein